MNRTIRMLCCFLAAVVLLSFAGCKETSSGIDVPLNVPTIPSQNDPASPTTSTAAGGDNTSATTTTGKPLQVNPITGVADMNGSSLSRPVGVMVANNNFIQSEQVGIGTADMWVEAETEGGITRLMAVYAGTDRVPESIGPVRSARTPFAKVAQALGLALAHAGGSYTALNYIAYSDIADLDVNGDDNGSPYSWRDSSYPHDYEYRLRTGGSELTKYMQDKSYSMTAVTDIPWTFGEQTGEAATSVSVTFSGAQTIGFTYDSASKVYTKTNGYSETVHKDSAGTAITPNTVLVLYTDRYWETDTTIDFYLQNGEGYVFSNGVMRRFDWVRDDSGFTMTEKDGSTLTIGKGKVYLCVVAASYSSDISYQ